VASGCLPVGYQMACGWPRGGLVGKPSRQLCSGSPAARQGVRCGLAGGPLRLATSILPRHGGGRGQGGCSSLALPRLGGATSNLSRAKAMRPGANQRPFAGPGARAFFPHVRIPVASFRRGLGQCSATFCGQAAGSPVFARFDGVGRSWLARPGAGDALRVTSRRALGLGSAWAYCR
jgi:hypothetical protein